MASGEFLHSALSPWPKGMHLLPRWTVSLHTVPLFLLLVQKVRRPKTNRGGERGTQTPNTTYLFQRFLIGGSCLLQHLRTPWLFCISQLTWIWIYCQKMTPQPSLLCYFLTGESACFLRHRARALTIEFPRNFCIKSIYLLWVPLQIIGI